MKKDMLKRFAALLVCGAMLLSGLGFADELGGVVSEAETPVQASAERVAETAAPVSSEGSGEVAEHNEEVPESSETPDVVLSEAAGGTVEGEAADGTVEGEATDGAADDTTGADTATAPDGEAVVANGALPDESGEGDGTDAAADSPAESSDAAETDGGLDEGEQEAVTDEPLTEADGGIMLMAIACPHEGSELEHITEYYARHVESWDDETHTAVVEVVTYDYCSECDVKKNLHTEMQEQEKQKHQLDEYGDCEICNFSHEHEWVGNSAEQTRTVYEDLGASGHAVYMEHYYEDGATCAICQASSWYTGDGDCSTRELITECEAHNTDGDGGKSCSKCGYEPEHKHSWVKQYSNVTYDEDRPQGENCVHIGRHISVDMYCSECDKTMTVETSYDPDAQDITPHRLRDGVCIICGYEVPECTHPNLFVEYTLAEDSLSGEEIESDGKGAHTGTLLVTTSYKCPDCFYRYTTVEEKTGTFPCELVESVVDGRLVLRCEVCGYSVDMGPGEESDCPGKDSDDCWYYEAHDPAYLLREHDNAAGDYTESRSVEGVGTAVPSSDGKTHVYPQTAKYEMYFCAKCRIGGIEKRVVVDQEFKEPHTFVDGVCIGCGCSESEAQACPHANMVRVKTTSPGDNSVGYVDINAQGHTMVHDQYYELQCSDCGMRFDIETLSSEYVYEEPEPHSFDVNGYCECGFPNPCDHVGKGEVLVHSDEHANQFESVDDKSHRAYCWYTEAYACAECGQLLPGREPKGTVRKNGTLESHNYEVDHEDGEYYYMVCSDCGHEFAKSKVCKHENIDYTKAPDKTEKSYASVDDLQHEETVKYGWICPDCQETVYPEDKVVRTKVNHTYEKGVCTDAGCGHVCAHSQVAEDAEPVEYDVLSCKSLDDVWHSVTKDLHYKCDCGGELVKHVVEAKEKHEYTDGECLVEGCGHVCEHSNKVLGEAKRIEDEKPVAKDDDSHSTGYREETPWTCPDCTLTGTAVKNFPTGDPVAHNYVKQGDDYVCSDCGHKCEHTGVTPSVKTDVTYPTQDDKTHTPLTVTVTTIACTHGHDAVETKTEATGEPEAHSYVDGVCTVCGHGCSHAAGEEAGEPVKSDYKRVAVKGNDKSHSVTYTLTTEYKCKDCQKVQRTEVKENQVEPEMEAHSYDANGTCKTCGYDCGHSEQATNVGVKRNVSYKSNGSKGHTVTYDLCDETYCTICGKIVESIPTEEDLSETEAHSFKGSKCTLCGYTKPSAPAATPTPTPAPTATPTPTPEPTEQPVATDEPVFEEVMPEEPVHGVTADSSTRMGTALGAAVTEIEKEYGTGTQLNIQNAEKVLPEKEYATFETLPAQEQIMVLVAVLSGESEAEHGVDELGMTLSNDAEQLIVNLQDWMQGMTVEESAAFMDLVKEYFTVEGEDDHLVITLEIKTESGTRYERYGFDLVDGVWVFQKLEVAEIPAAA